MDQRMGRAFNSSDTGYGRKSHPIFLNYPTARRATALRAARNPHFPALDPWPSSSGPPMARCCHQHWRRTTTDIC
jgi:hypothetical protein